MVSESLSFSLWVLCPEIVLLGIGVLWVLGISLVKTKTIFKSSSIVFALLILLVSVYSLWHNKDVYSLFFDSILIDKDVQLYRLFLDISGLIGIFLIQKDNSFSTSTYASLFAVYLFILLGLHLMLMTHHWAMFMVSVEMVSIGSYLMVAYAKNQNKTSEASLKYTLLGLLVSACIFYAISILYAFSGSLAWSSEVLPHSPLLNIAFLLIIIGFSFKLGFFPTHFWIPDVFEGVPISILAYLSTLPKIASAFLFFKFWNTYAIALQPIENVFIILLIVTLLLGNLVAMWQDSLKKLLAYSGIGHTGFLMLIVCSASSATQDTLRTLTFYLISYVSASLILFIVLLTNNSDKQYLRDYSGYAKTHPLTSIAMTIAMISLIGLPINMGFWAKFYVFSQVLEVYDNTENIFYIIAILVSVLCTIFSMYYYFRWLKPMFFYTNNNELEPSTPLLFKVLIGILSIYLLLLGFFPYWI